MRPPSPAATLQFRSPNACNLCHTDKDATWADDWVRRWYPRDYQAPILAQGKWIEAGRRQDWSQLDDMLDYLRGPDRDAVVSASLVNLLDACEDERKWPVLEGLLTDESPLVRAAAIDRFDGRVDPPALDRLVAATKDDGAAGARNRLRNMGYAAGGAGVPASAIAVFQHDREATVDGALSDDLRGTLEDEHGS